MVFNFTNPLGGAEISAPTACVLTDTQVATCTGSLGAYTVENAVQVTPETATNALGVPEVFTFHFPPDYTCASDLDGDLVTPECVIGDVLADAGLTVTGIAPGPVDQNGSDTIQVTVVNSAPNGYGSFEVCLSVALGDEVPVIIPIVIEGLQGSVESLTRITDEFISECGTKAYVQPELRHISDYGDVISLQELNNNVRGSQHTVCVTDGYPNNNPLLIPQLNAQPSDFINQVPDAYDGDENVGPQSPTASNITVFTGTGGFPDYGLAGATCVSWYSTGAGDQQLSLDYVGADGATYTIDWDTNDDGNGGTSPVNDSIIKEWNVLEDSHVEWSGAASGSVTQDLNAPDNDPAKHITIPLYLNPATGRYNWSTDDTHLLLGHVPGKPPQQW